MSADPNATRAPQAVRERPTEHIEDHDKAGCCDHHHSPQLGPIDRTAIVSGRGINITRGRRAILSDVDIDVREKEIVTLIGPNGAGKTTLVRALLGIEKPDSGEIHRRKNLRIGYVPQRFHVDRAIPLTVTRFLQLGLALDQEHITEILTQVGVIKLKDQQMSALSGGELQRVILARALARDPKLLVLDEPVHGVDTVGEAELYTLIGKLRDERGFGVILVSHDLHVVMAASDRVLCVNRHVCCSGVPTAVAQHPEYARLFGAKAAKAFAVYEHHHDHDHDHLGGEPLTGSEKKTHDNQVKKKDDGRDIS